MVAEQEQVVGQRTWFVDSRSPSRRLGVTTHPDAGLVVLSLWQGDRCTGSFRLPLEAAPALVEALTARMDPEKAPPPRSSPSPSLLRRIK